MSVKVVEKRVSEEVATVRRHGWKFRRIGVDQRRCKFDHSLDLHVAVLEQPLVVLFEQHGADQPSDAGLVGEDADDVGSPLDLLVQPFQGVG
jgi:NADPH-dependent glutamate synthase beta subunit-like oxidoreductase